MARNRILNDSFGDCSDINGLIFSGNCAGAVQQLDYQISGIPAGSYRMALYLLSWVNPDRLQEIDVCVTDTSGTTCALQASVEEHYNGTYEFFELDLTDPTAVVKITQTSFNSPRSMVSGLFFDSIDGDYLPDNTGCGNEACYLGDMSEDIMTGGNWVGVYGADGYIIINRDNPLPANDPDSCMPAQIELRGDVGNFAGMVRPSMLATGNTGQSHLFPPQFQASNNCDTAMGFLWECDGDNRALSAPINGCDNTSLNCASFSNNVASTWDDAGENNPDGPELGVDIVVDRPGEFYLTVYAVDYDYLDPNPTQRRQRYYLYQKGTTIPMGTSVDIGTFDEGAYVTWHLQGPFEVTLVADKYEGDNAIISGIFLDSPLGFTCEPEGACCSDTGCVDTTEDLCDGDFDPDSACSDNPCPPPPPGSCCYYDQVNGDSCDIVDDEMACTLLGGTFNGPGSTCDECKGPCCDTVTCTLTFEDECAPENFGVIGSDCGLVTCPGLVACCLGETCTQMTEASCLAQGGEPQGVGSCDQSTCATLGACCDGDECELTTPENCSDEGFNGLGSSCLDAMCPDKGACCTGDGCHLLTEEACESEPYDGVYQGNDSICETSCFGACCDYDGQGRCQDGVQLDDCTGDFMGADSTCIEDCLGACCADADPLNCLQTIESDCEGTFGGVPSSCETSCANLGACCSATGCWNVNENSCLVDYGGEYMGDGSTCSTPGICEGACCKADAPCDPNATLQTCDGEFQGIGVDCSVCEGACCNSDGGGSCEVMFESDCTATGTGAWQDKGTDCLADCDGACCFGPSDCNDNILEAQCDAFLGNWTDVGIGCELVVCDEIPGECPDGGGSGELCTYTIGGWGQIAHGNNPGSIRDAHWNDVYNTGTLLFATPFCTETLSFTGSEKVEQYLPCGGTPDSWSGPDADPSCGPSEECVEECVIKQVCTGKGKKKRVCHDEEVCSEVCTPTGTTKNILASQLIGARLNRDYSCEGVLPAEFPNEDSDVCLGDLIVTGGAFAGKSVDDVLRAGTAALLCGTLPSGVSFSQMSDALTGINENYSGCTNNNGFLQCPEAPGGPGPGPCDVSILKEVAAVGDQNGDLLGPDVIPGQSLLFSLTVHANGCDLPNVIVTDTLPSFGGGDVYLDFDCYDVITSSPIVTCGYNAAARRITFDLGAMLAGSTINLSYPLQVNPLIPLDSMWVNTARVEVSQLGLSDEENATVFVAPGDTPKLASDDIGTPGFWCNHINQAKNQAFDVEFIDAWIYNIEMVSDYYTSIHPHTVAQGIVCQSERKGKKGAKKRLEKHLLTLWFNVVSHQIWTDITLDMLCGGSFDADKLGLTIGEVLAAAEDALMSGSSNDQDEWKAVVDTINNSKPPFDNNGNGKNGLQNDPVVQFDPRFDGENCGN